MPRAKAKKVDVQQGTLLPSDEDRALGNLSPEPSSTMSARDKAQDLAWDAMDAASETEVRALLKRALALDAQCVDALVMLAQLEARSSSELTRRLEEAVEIGAQALGERFFRENKGEFWGLFETRPYMRALYALADELRDAGHVRKAAECYETLLELNPEDNQGARYALLGCCLASGRLAEVQALLEAYRGDDTAVFAWAQVLERYLSRDLAGARRALEMARRVNPFVEQFMTGERPFPEERAHAYALGSPEEAVVCIDCLGAAWAKNRAAMFWLLDRISPLGRLKQRGKKKPQGPSVQ